MIDKFTVFERIMRELNFVAWCFECQVSDVNFNSLPFIHQQGRYLPNIINIQSNIPMLKIQDYFQHYTERFERANDKTVLSNELIDIYKRAKQIISFYNENLHSNSDCVKSYFEKLPTDFKNKIDYNKKHTALIVVNDLQILDIYFEVGNFKNKNYYDKNSYKVGYLTDNAELLRFCQKLIDFVGRFQVNLSDVLEPEKLEYLRRLCEISIDYSKDSNWSIGTLPIEFDAITKVDLFVENLIKSIEILANEGKDVHQLIDLFIQGTKTDLENPLLEKNAKITKHLLNKLEGVKLLLLNVKDLPPQQEHKTENKEIFTNFEIVDNNGMFEKDIKEIPFIDCIDKTELFTQYLQTAKIPDFQLYINHFSDINELEKLYNEKVENEKRFVNKGVYSYTSEYDVKIQELYNSFTSDIAEKKLSNECFKHNISKTQICIALEKINNLYKGFFETLRTKIKEIDRYKEPEQVANNIISEMRSFSNYTKINIIDAIVNNTSGTVTEYISMQYTNPAYTADNANLLATLKTHLLKYQESINKNNIQNLESNRKATEKQESEPQISTVSNDIESAFSFMQQNDPRKHKRIISDDDFDSLMKWITYYFENDFNIPEIDKPIKVINTNKGNVVYTFIKIFKDLHPTKTRPDSLFELIKLCFYDYRNDNISNYKKQKEPQFYSQLINKK